MLFEPQFLLVCYKYLDYKFVANVNCNIVMTGGQFILGPPDCESTLSGWCEYWLKLFS